MSETPAISVIVPTWNRAAYLAQALASIAAQTFRDFEVIVVDDGSRDDTDAVLEQFYPACRVFRQTHKGVAAARNLGVAKAHGEWIAFLDSDDIWYPEKLQMQFNRTINRPDVALVFSDYKVWDDTGGQSGKVKVRRYLEPDTSLNALLRKNFIGTLTVLVRRSVLLATGGFDETLSRGSDYDAWLRVAQQGKLMRVPGVVARYRRHAHSLTGLDPGQDGKTRDLVLSRFDR